MQSFIEPFTRYLAFEKRYSPHTIRAYQDDLVQFFDFITMEFGDSGPEGVSPAMIRSWLASLKEAGTGSRSINRKISSLKSFYKYQLKMGVIRQTPMSGVVSPKMNKRLPMYVEQRDIGTLFGELPFPDNWEGLTDRMLLAIFYQTGMRLSELVGLREKQVDRGNRSLKVLGKGGKERVIPVNPVLIRMIDDYCAKKRSVLEDADREVLLVTEKGRPLYAKYVYRAVRKYLGQVTTIDKKSPHVLRHSFATHLLHEGAELNSVKELLGHASLAATQIYTHNTIEQLKEIHKRAHPKGGR